MFVPVSIKSLQMVQAVELVGLLGIFTCKQSFVGGLISVSIIYIILFYVFIYFCLFLAEIILHSLAVSQKRAAHRIIAL